MRFTQLTLLFAVGCSTTTGDDGNTPVYTTFPDPTFVDTGFPPGDLANIQIRYDVNEQTTKVFALFTESAPNFLNLAKCAIEQSTCIPTMPTDEQNPVTFDPDDSIETETIRTRFVGDVLGVGPYALPYLESPETKLGFYTVDVTKQGLVEGWIGASWAGQWPVYVGTQDLFVPPPVAIITPKANGIINMVNNTMVPFEWVPTGEGDITLTLIPESGDAIVYRLEDDGYYELDTNDLITRLKITDEVTEFTGFLTRWSRNTLIKFGHVVEYVASSDVQFSPKLIQVGLRERLNAADECAQAQGAVPLLPGEFWGYNGEPRFDADYTATTTCLDPGFSNAYSGSSGPDGIFRVEVEPRHQVTFDYNLLTENASVYLVDDCNNTLTTCVDGSDLSPDPDGHEYVSFFNADDDTRTLYLVLDGAEAGKESYYTLDMSDEFFDEPDMYDTCADAMMAEPTVGEGTWWGTFVAYTSGTNPGTGGCTGTSLGGPEAMTPVEVPPFSTMTASVIMGGSDVGLYLLFNCNDAFSCPVGSDTSQTGRENVFFDNSNNMYPVNLYVVVDSKTGMAPYFLTIDFE